MIQANGCPHCGSTTTDIDHDAQHVCCISCGYIYAEFY